MRTAGTRRVVLAAIETSLNELRALLDGLRVVRELTPRTSDYIAARGERLSAMLLAAALADTRRRVRLVDAVELIVTDGHFGAAAPDFAATDRRVRQLVGPLLQRGIIPVVPGFIGAGPGGDLVTLGRGGSDLTATLLARALRASSVSLWKDVPGFLTGDPRVVADARVIPELHVREAAELAYYGAKVLHPRALIPLSRRPIPVYVRPFANPASQGTEVSQHRRRTPSPVRAVSGIGAQALVTVTGNGMLGVPGVAARTFETLQRSGFPGVAGDAGLVGSLAHLQRARGAGGAGRGGATAASSARRSRDRISTASRCAGAWRPSPSWAGAWPGRAASRRACSARWPTPASISWPSRRDRRSSTSRSSSRSATPPRRSAASMTPSSWPRSAAARSTRRSGSPWCCWASGRWAGRWRG